MNVLTTDNYQKKIESMTPDDWMPLLDLIPVIEMTETFYSPGILSFQDEDIVEIGRSKQNPVIHTFREIVYQIPVIIDFGWAQWDEGSELAGNPDTDYDAIDIPTKCKLITAFVRNDRFCEGTLASRFEDGTILKILRSIRNQLADAS
jgi:hypothetical protein